ncbi:hypothetical protein N9937_00925 [bacterium]|nr:hypothetical protein [bacterium]
MKYSVMDEHGNCHDIPESVIKRIKAEAIEDLSFEIGPFWAYEMKGGCLLSKMRTYLRNRAAEMVRRSDG